VKTVLLNLSCAELGIFKMQLCQIFVVNWWFRELG